MNMPAVLSNHIHDETKILEFTEEFVTGCVEKQQPVFVWDGTKGAIRDYLLKEQAGDWKLKIISSFKTPTVGYVIAVPTGRRTAEIYKTSKTVELIAAGFGEAFVKLYISRSRNVRYNMELETIKWVFENYLMPDEDFQKISNAGIPRVTAIGRGYDVSLAQTRFEFAMQIVRAIRNDDPIIKFCVRNRNMPLEHIQQIQSATGMVTPTLVADTLGYFTDLDNYRLTKANSASG